MDIYMGFLRLLLSSNLIFAIFINRNVIADNFHYETSCFPDNIVPMDYSVKLTLHVNDYKNNDKYTSDYRVSFPEYIKMHRTIGNLIFEGESSILVNITRSTRNIKLHLRQSQIKLSTLNLRNASIKEHEIQPLYYAHNYDMQVYILHYQNELKEGLYFLTTNFKGTIGEDLAISYTIRKRKM